MSSDQARGGNACICPLRGTGIRGTTFGEAWSWLREHPALTWVPPLWRSNDESAIGGTGHTIRAIECNLVVTVEHGTHGPVIRLITGPLKDRPWGDGTIDPLVPASVRDERVAVQAGSFEEAVVALAARVASVYGDCQ